MNNCLSIDFMYVIVKPNAKQYIDTILTYFQNVLNFKIMKECSVDLDQ